MPGFDYKEYQKDLANSQIIIDCERVPVPSCAEHQNYIFVSYSHRDYKKVYHVLAELYHAGVRFWYDAELTAGLDWDDEVCRKINDPHCSGVIFFLSDDFFKSQIIIVIKNDRLINVFFCLFFSSTTIVYEIYNANSSNSEKDDSNKRRNKQKQDSKTD